MRTTFGSFNIATSGLFASQRSLDTTSHNISNANTDGYSRQISKQRATMPTYGDPTGVVGTGVETYDIIRMRSSYLDTKYWGQNKTYQEWNVKQTQLENLEGLFNEPSDTGIRIVMDEFFTALEELSKQPGDSTCRVNVVEKANMLTTTINRNGHELVNSIRDVNFSIKNKVSQVNSLTEQIANLNKHIFSFELGGNKANDLRDQRTLLLDELSSIINITVIEMPGPNNNNYMDVKVGGITLIDHIHFNKLATEDETKEVSDLGGGKISKVVWEGLDNQEVNISSGELRGLLDVRDGNGEDYSYRGIPYYLNKLNEYVKGFTTAFNTQHKMGVDLQGDPGQNFFYEPGIPEVNCISFKVNSDIIADPTTIAASSQGNGESNNDNIKLLIALRENKGMFSSLIGTPDDFVKSILSALAVDSNQAKRMTTNAQALTDHIYNSRLSESGVSLDEEMTNMVKFQQAYNASARMVTTLDAILDTTVNRLGLVGR
ncbi:MAG TPA: flagellar hook-associated protein FlgK [Bacillota bacterium]|nr:flagellar hook-associated protein FlgK [Bacillota bacterium]HNT02611.1 flagellar hook-associated protein FlgK [Bacillota bacterium]HOH88717.1 flagellar hook-associated protein FlgK [Bacillota bacterium]HPX68254.1 flagellar hook-associated protein FlgK [Bacillota bacterium]HQA65287.1 flagellar hook-associated protein FlgK [Bacillota bacterium]